jgi:hypothetical protein
MFATFSPKYREQSPISVNFKKPLSNADIVDLKATIEDIFKVSFDFSGPEFDYNVVMCGSTKGMAKAINFLFPKAKSDIVTQRSQF